MSRMEGNPHYGDAAEAGVYFANRVLPADSDVIALANTEAILALAYEQRTANLIAKLALNIQSTAAGVHVNPSAAEIDNDVLARLDLSA